MLTPFQEIKYRLLFDLLDYDRNGHLDVNDFTGIAENARVVFQLSEEDPDSVRMKEICISIWTELYSYVDDNKDGKASMWEWLKYVDEKIIGAENDLNAKNIVKLAHELFFLFDQNKDNYISLDEYIDFFMTFRLDASTSSKAFTSLDKNLDDRISRAELMKGLEEFLISSDPSSGGNWLFGKPKLYN